MAFVANASPDQDPNQQGQNPQANQAPVTSAPNAGGTGKATTGQPSNSTAAQPFTNLSSYLTANEPQITNMANNVASGLTNQYNATTGAIDAAGQNFGKDVNAGYTQNDPNVLSGFQSDPTKVAADPNQSKTFTGMYNDTYSGPTTFQDSSYYAPLSAQVQAGTAAATQANSAGGLQTYLTAQNPGYTKGQSTLDSVLLQGNPGAAQTISNAAQPFTNLPGYLQNTVASGNTAAQAAQQQAQQTKAATQAAFNDTATKFNTQVGNEATAAQKQAQQFNANYNDIIAKLSGTMPVGSEGGIQSLTPEEQAALGVNQSAIGQYAQANSILEHYGQAPDSFLFGEPQLNGLPSAGPVPLANYLTGGHIADLPQNASAIATPEEYAKAAALSKLGGAAYTSPLDQNYAALAGSYKPDGVYQTFDQTKANGLIDAVTSRDKAISDQLIGQNAGTVNGSFAGVKHGDYAGALAALQKDLASNPGNMNSSLAYEMDALNRLANGFGAPDIGYTPTPTPPSLGGGVGPTTPPPSSSGPGRAFR